MDKVIQVSKTEEKVINDYKARNFVTITLWDDKTLQEIKEKSGELAEDCEYQVHYWSLNLQKVFSDNSVCLVHIPTCIFNYPIEVSHAAIDFDLNDVEKISEMVLPLQQLEVSKALEAVKHIPELEGFTPISVSLNTLHRHP